MKKQEIIANEARRSKQNISHYSRYMDMSYGNMREIFPKTNQVRDGKDFQTVAKTFSEELKEMGLLEEIFKCLEVLEDWDKRNRQIRAWSSPVLYSDGRYSIVALLNQPDEDFFTFVTLEQFLTTIARNKETLSKWKEVFAKRDAEDEDED